MIILREGRIIKISLRPRHGGLWRTSTIIRAYRTKDLYWRHFYHLKKEWRRRLSTYSISSLNNQPSVLQWRLRMATQFPFLTHWSQKIQKDASHYKCLSKTYTHWSVPVLWHTTLNQSNDVLSSAYTMHRKISSLNHLLPLRKKSI